MLWSNPKALFVCIRSHTTIIELSICVLNIFCFLFQLHLYLALDAGEGDDHHGLSSGPRESICYPTSWCWGQGAVHISYLKPFAINKMFPAFSIVFSGLPVRRQHRGGWEDPGGAQGEVWGGRGGLHQVLSWHDHDPQSPKSTLQWSRCDVTKTDDLIALYDNCEKHFGAKVMLSQLAVLKMLDILTFWNLAKVEIFCNNAGINSKVAGWKRWWSHLGWWWRWC